jgi:hypothetical protein
MTLRHNQIYEELKEMVKILYTDGLNTDEICSAFNLLPDSVRQLYRRKPQKITTCNLKHLKEIIDRDKFIDLWKKGIPYSVMSNYFGVSRDSIMFYKSYVCRDITRTIICVRCGQAYETDRYRRELCDVCNQIGRELHFLAVKKRERIARGNLLQIAREEREMKAREREDRKRAKDKRRKENRDYY